MYTIEINYVQGTIMEQVKMIIIDDEPIILRGLVETYPWSEMGFTIVGATTKPELGLRLIEEKRPQVVLTDIRMNRMDGLTLIEKVREFDEDIIFIVMSAYKEFEYARKACEQRVFRYLVKPVEEKVLVDTMQAVYEHCENKINVINEYDYLKEILIDQKEDFQNVMMKRYLREEINEASFVKSLDRIGTVIKIGTGFIGAQMSFDITDCILNQEEFETQSFAVFTYLEKQIFKYYNGWHFKSGQDKIVFILNVEEMEDIEKLKEIIGKARKLTNMEMSSVISSIFYGIKGLKLAYAQLQERYSLVCESGVHLLMGADSIEVQNKDKVYLESEELLIINSIRKGNKENLKAAYIHFLVEIEKIYSSEYIKKCLQRIALNVEFFVFDTYGKNEELEHSFDNFYIVLPTLSKEKAQDVLFELLKKVVDIKNTNLVEKDKKYFNEYIYKALEYIEQNLVDESLSITSVSEHVYLNPVYFGRIFKSALNMSFKQYVLNKRIELAKKKIIEDDSSIVTVGNEVGISNSSYFTQIFKKTTGYLPSEYKKEMMNEKEILWNT